MISDSELLERYNKCGRKTINVSAELRMEGINISDRTVRRRLADAFPGYNRKDFSPTDEVVIDAELEPKLLAAGTLHAPDRRRAVLSGKRYVFTAAQNNTYVHEDFIASILQFCKHNDAQLVVSKFTYNKSGFQNNTKEDGSEDLWYDPRLSEYFINESVQVAQNLIFCGELDILPTAVNPISGLENYTMGASGIIPHAKVAMTPMPRMKYEDPRFLYTTGAITLRNYIQRKAGQKAEFHHVFGALYVEIDEAGRWFARQLIADNTGEFYDLTNKYTPHGVETGLNVKAINWGDIHIEKIDMSVAEASWGDNSMLTELQPEFQFIHDLTDFRARNHHNIDDPYFIAEQHFAGKSSVEADMESAAYFLKQVTRFGNIAVVVESNHDQAFKRWLREADVTQDPTNAEYWHLNNAAIYKAIRTGDKEFNVFEYALNKVTNLDNVIFLQEDDSFVVCNNEDREVREGVIEGGIECGMHGHRGPNGARGTSRGFRNVGRKVNTGHSHSAGIVEGVYTAGVSCELDMGYNKGPSSWSHSHIITYQNGKRAIVTLKDGKWKAN